MLNSLSVFGTWSGRVAQMRRDGVWPRVYRIRLAQRMRFRVLGFAAIAGGMLGAGILLVDASAPHPAFALLPLLFVALGVYVLMAVAAERLVLYEEAIEFVELGRGHRRARREEITGLRMVPLQHGFQRLVLVLRGGSKPLEITWMHEIDPVLQTWLDAIPNLDAEERARAEAELLRSPSLGTDETERARALSRARRFARTLHGASVAAAAWGWLYPRPYPAAILALGLLPLVGIGAHLAGRGRYSLDDGRNDPRPTLLPTVIMPGLVIALRATLDLHVIDWIALLVGAAVAGLALVVAIGVHGRSPKLLFLALLYPLISGYSWGTLSLANALLDRAAPEVVSVPVRGKRAAGGKHTSWELKLDPWGPRVERESVDVSQELYRAVSEGDRVCAVLHPGALGVRWFVVRACRPGER